MNKRRKLVVAFGAGALTAPVGTFAQEPGRVRRIGVLMGFAESDTEAQLRLAGFKDALAALGWVVGRNLRLDVRWTVADLDATIKRLGREPDSSLIVMVDSFSFLHRKSIIALASNNKVPAIYALGRMVEEGGLMSYGVEILDQFRRAASYVDRILRGAKPAELPVQLPATFELFINRKTAQTLGLTIPQSMLIGADKIVE